jgi:hypothetical protein
VGLKDEVMYHRTLEKIQIGVSLLKEAKFEIKAERNLIKSRLLHTERVIEPFEVLISKIIKTTTLAELEETKTELDNLIKNL